MALIKKFRIKKFKEQNSLLKLEKFLCSTIKDKF